MVLGAQTTRELAITIELLYKIRVSNGFRLLFTGAKMSIRTKVTDDQNSKNILSQTSNQTVVDTDADES